jgi:hypothetical protein
MKFAQIVFLLILNVFTSFISGMSLSNATVPVRIQFTTCTSSGSGSNSRSFYVSFPSVSSSLPQQITDILYYSGSTYSQVFFVEEYPSDINITASSDDALCLSAMIINNNPISFPEGNIWLDSPCSGTYGNTGNEICRKSNLWTFPQVSYGEAYGVQVSFTTCSKSGSTSNNYFYVSFPSNPSFPSQQVSQYFSSYSTTYTQNFYPLDTLPTSMSFQSLTTDALCLSGITINQMELNFTSNIWFDYPCSGSYGGGDPCYTNYTWNFNNITNYGEVLYFYYHTCSYSDSSSSSSYFYVSFPSVPSYVEDRLDWPFTISNQWYYQQYYLEESPTDLKMEAATSDQLCLDLIRFDESNALYFKKSHYYLDDPCDSSSSTSSNYSKYCKTIVTWPVNKTSNDGNEDDDQITMEDIQFLITAGMISGVVTLGLVVIGLLLCCCYIHVPTTRKFIGKEEPIADRLSTVNPLNQNLNSDETHQKKKSVTTNHHKKTFVIPAAEIRLNATSGAPQADAINQELDHVIRLALQDIASLAENDQEYLIGKIKFSVSSSRLTKIIEFLCITILGGISLSLDTCPNWFCKMYLTISCYIWFLTIILRYEQYPFSSPSPPKPLERKIYKLIIANKVSRYQDRIYYPWDRNKNGQIIRVYEEPEVGTNEVQIAADFQKYQEILKKQNRLSGPVFQYTPREWSKERAEAKASVEEINARNVALAREENQKREIKQQEMDRERHEKDKENLEKYRQQLVNHELWAEGWEVALSYVYCLVSLCSVVLFVTGLFWNVTCSGTGSVICNFIVFPTIVFEFMFIITYTKREKISFEARREAVINF